MVRPSGDFAGVFEYDGEAAYFYLYATDGGGGGCIVGAIQVFSGHFDVPTSEVRVAWNHSDERVGLFLRGELWAVFNLSSGGKFGGNYSQTSGAQIPTDELFNLMRAN
jgi:hypothetical protein